MKQQRGGGREGGFTLIELLVALGIFLLVTGAAFTLLSTSQQRYQAESQVLNSFQEGRLGLDQMVRDINDAGFPPKNFFDANHPLVSASFPFGWSPGYSSSPPIGCQIVTGGGGNCVSPTDFDLIIETNPGPNRDPACAPYCYAQWIRYRLQGTTLMRAVVDKQTLGNPVAATAQAGFVPFVQNVVNNSPGLQVSVDAHGNPILLSAEYPLVFAGGPVPIFQYSCDTPLSAPQNPPQSCAGLGNLPDNSPTNIRDVTITLIVAAPSPDPASGRTRLVQLQGRGRRINPNQ